MNLDDTIDKKTAKELNLKLMKYAPELPNFRAATKVETVMNKILNYKILIKGQITTYETPGKLMDLNEPSTSIKESRESLIPIPTKKFNK